MTGKSTLFKYFTTCARHAVSNWIASWYTYCMVLFIIQCWFLWCKYLKWVGMLVMNVIKCCLVWIKFNVDDESNKDFDT